jgi:hypothetical protein
MRSKKEIEKRLEFWKRQIKYYKEHNGKDQKVKEGMNKMKIKINALRWVLGEDVRGERWT